MKNTAERIRIIRVFKKYSRLGLASNNLDALDVYERIKGCSASRRQANELLAVYETLRFLRISGKLECIDALKEVYFSLSDRTPRRNEISERVLRYSQERYCDQRTVYRHLSYAVRLYERILTSSL